VRNKEIEEDKFLDLIMSRF